MSEYCKNCFELQQQCEKYEQALDEIYEICKQALDDNFVRPVVSSLIELINEVEG